ncbi:hypothetical protein ACTU44_17210 [Thalassospira sp. SM2505]
MMDLWDVATFDRHVVDLLTQNECLVRDFFEEENRIFISYDLCRDPDLLCRPNNKFYDAYSELEEEVAARISRSSFRAFHYTRLTEDEVRRLRNFGIELSSSETLEHRLASQVAVGNIPADCASQLFNLSPLQNGQKDNRSGMFWLASWPVPVSDGGVNNLLSHWGGEVVYMWLQDKKLTELIQSIGKPTVVEVCVPMSSTKDVFRASRAVVRTFARSLGLHAEGGEFDVCVRENLPPTAILRVHQSGDLDFMNLAQGYPKSYSRNDNIWWEEHE